MTIKTKNKNLNNPKEHQKKRLTMSYVPLQLVNRPCVFVDYRFGMLSLTQTFGHIFTKTHIQMSASVPMSTSTSYAYRL